MRLRNILLSIIINSALAKNLDTAQPRVHAQDVALTNGGIPVLLYHSVDCRSARLAVCPDSLYTQLKFMHNHGFRPVTIDEYATNNYGRLQPGEKPYLITFDDGLETQFQLRNGRVSATSAVGVIEQFRYDYNVRAPAYFYVNTIAPVFGNRQQELEKLEYLTQHDFGIGNHTASHTNLFAASRAKTFDVFKRADRTLDYLVGADWGATRTGTRTGSYPYGGLPDVSIRLQVEHELGYTIFFHAYGGLAKQPGTLAFDPAAVNRYETNSTSTKPGGIQFFLERFTIARVARVTRE